MAKKTSASKKSGRGSAPKPAGKARPATKLVPKKASVAKRVEAAAKRNDKKPDAPAAGPNAAIKKTVRKPAKAPQTPEQELRRVDADVLKLINRRAVLTSESIHTRVKAGGSLFDPHGDDQLLAELIAANPGPLPEQAIRGVFREIVSAARRTVRAQRVAYLGPPFSFTHIAAIERFGKWADLIPVSTIATVFEEVNRGHAEFGLVPIENSTDGRVVDTLHMFTRLPLRICGEVRLAIHHNLLGRSPRGEITEVYSKPQALSQCRDWLARNMPQARLFEVTSTSTAAQLARDKPGVGAVASLQAAVEYDLQVLAENIEDNPDNVTRFAVIGDNESGPTGVDRTSVLLQIPHRPGSLSEALVAFKKNKVNLTWIESFPLGNGETGYLFFLDFEGHIADPKTKRTLADLEETAVSLKVLGSYPISEPRS